MKKIFVVLVLSCLFIQCGIDHSNTSAINGKPFPDFNYQLLDSTTVVKSSDFKKDGPLLLFIFDPDCPFCNEQVRRILTNINLFHGANLYFVSYAPIKYLREFNTRLKLDQYSNIVVGRDTSALTAKYFSLQNVPFSGIYNSQHIFKTSYNGVVEAKEIQEQLFKE